MLRSNITISSGFRCPSLCWSASFPVVYGVELKDVLPREDLAIGSYRYSVSQHDPGDDAGRAADPQEGHDAREPNFAKRKFLYRLSRSDYEKEWGKEYTKPGFGTRVLVSIHAITCRK